jgi:hypothetical protein
VTIHSEYGYGGLPAYCPQIASLPVLHVPSRLRISMKWSANSV